MNDEISAKAHANGVARKTHLPRGDSEEPHDLAILVDVNKRRAGVREWVRKIQFREHGVEFRGSVARTGAQVIPVKVRHLRNITLNELPYRHDIPGRVPNGRFAPLREHKK